MRRRHWIAAAVGGAAAMAVAAAVIVGVTPDRPDAAPTRAERPTPTVTSTPAPTLAAVPAAPSTATLAALPLAFHDAVVPALLDGTTVEPVDTWQIATPRQPLVPLYAESTARARPVATLSNRVSTIDLPAATAVWGRSPAVDGGMLLLSTPARNRTPGDGGDPDAPSATFAWARAADFTITTTDRMIRVDVARSTVSVITRAGEQTATEAARLGTPEDPTPTATATYVEAAYVDTRVTYTQGNPIILTGAHSARIPSYGGNAALTALHFYPDPTGSSHGCVRISAEMTRTLAALPVGTPIRFT
ncbi:L,D-transpeptidase family protein [Curtobacterium sp. MCPF17_002]|uniref:L,D-transpeptidase n=1 Tax=Curtobacterium sp. MCPF17_002 TaxID=2175645 RepID=UPI000DA7FB5C|nr:L,D-transpeptidase [Curtobacterium sp. MCPF17_002]WIB76150.1 L,D-transpeptidase family protein [Curtobacterium sp. MCPF17_002]